MRQAYIQKSNRTINKIIGLSWRGGGTGTRMKEKSLEPKLFAQILKDFDDILFVSLQYGDPTPEIKLWKDLGIEILHDLR